MLQEREIISSAINRYMLGNGYIESPRTKITHSLDSWVYRFVGTEGNIDAIKIEINYSLRSHIFPSEKKKILPELFSNEIALNCLNSIEIFAGKTIALLDRAAPRDLYDIYNMIMFEIFNKKNYEMLRKSVVFYSAISFGKMNEIINIETLNKITKRNVRTNLIPVITKNEIFDLEKVKLVVNEYILDLMKLSENEIEFLQCLTNRQYMPELLFEDKEILARIRNHPMILWKISEPDKKIKK